MYQNLPDLSDQNTWTRMMVGCWSIQNDLGDRGSSVLTQRTPARLCRGRADRRAFFKLEAIAAARAAFARCQFDEGLAISA